MPSRWIRLDTTWSSSGWLAELEPAARLCWIELLCYVKAHGTAGTVKALSPQVAARKWGIATVTAVTRDAVTVMLEAAQEHGALVVEGSEWTLTKWRTYQGDETASDRSKRYRQSKSRLSTSRASRVSDVASRSVTHVTPTETETETETLETTHTHRAHEGLVSWLGRHADCAGGIEYVTQMALWGLYGPSGTDERVWGRIPPPDRPPLLATAVMRWTSEGHERFKANLFRAILTTVISDGNAHRTTGATGTDGPPRRPIPSNQGAL